MPIVLYVRLIPADNGIYDNFAVFLIITEWSFVTLAVEKAI